MDTVVDFINVNRDRYVDQLKEYLATGKPAVVRDLPAVREWADCLDAIGTAEEFSAAVRKRISLGLPDDQRTARRRLEHEGWSEKARLFESWIVGNELSS